MTNKEILEKALRKACDNSYGIIYTAPLERNWSLLLATYPIIIFSHEFAKAFWGKYPHSFYSHSMQGHNDGDICDCGEEQSGDWTKYCWQYHLQQMIIEKEPLKYLEKFL